jgi:small subunit ribosomal protein S1
MGESSNFNEAAEELILGTVLEAEVKLVLHFSALVKVKIAGKYEYYLNGIIKSNEISWDKNHANPHHYLHEGEKISVVLIGFDNHNQNERLLLSLKRVEYDPWNSLEEDFKVGLQIKGKVSHLTANFAVIEL